MAFLNNTRNLQIKGRLYSGNVSETQEKLEYALEVFNTIEINLSEIEVVDIAGVFMLYLMLCKAKEKNKKIVFTGLDNPILHNALYIAGLHNAFHPAAAA